MKHRPDLDLSGVDLKGHDTRVQDAYFYEDQPGSDTGALVADMARCLNCGERLALQQGHWKDGDPVIAAVQTIGTDGDDTVLLDDPCSFAAPDQIFAARVDSPSGAVVRFGLEEAYRLRVDPVPEDAPYMVSRAGQLARARAWAALGVAWSLEDAEQVFRCDADRFSLLGGNLSWPGVERTDAFSDSMTHLSLIGTSEGDPVEMMRSSALTQVLSEHLPAGVVLGPAPFRVSVVNESHEKVISTPVATPEHAASVFIDLCLLVADNHYATMPDVALTPEPYRTLVQDGYAAVWFGGRRVEMKACAPEDPA